MSTQPTPLATDAGTSSDSVFHRRKYELLLVALLQHLFIAVLLPDLDLYAQYIWPLNMAVLGVFSVGLFAQRSAAQRALKNLILVLVVAFPLAPWVFDPGPVTMVALSITYVVFFVVILCEVMRHLLRPSYIDLDLVSAAICGLLLLLEIGIFVMQSLYYCLPGAFHGLDTTSFTSVYLDLVYYTTVLLTSIGFGDIAPAHHMSKLASAMLGIGGQLYSVVLVGILISKYAAAPSRGDG